MMMFVKMRRSGDGLKSRARERRSYLIITYYSFCRSV